MGTEVYESPSDENLVSFCHEYLNSSFTCIIFRSFLRGEYNTCNHVKLATRAINVDKKN